MGVSPGPWPPNPGQTVERSAVSELLAGGRSTPGRSPGAARVRGLLATPAGADPIPTNGATGSRPLRGSGGREYGPRIWRNYVLEGDFVIK